MKLAKRLFSIFTIAIVIAVATHYFVNHQSSSANPAQLPAPVSLWRSTNGPRDAQTASLVTMNGQLFAAATNGVWTSNDNGQNWQQRNTGLPEIFSGVSSLAVIETTLFAATETGIYRTNDGGAHWQGTNVGLPSYFLGSQMLVDGSKLYLSTYGLGLFVSADKGDSWMPLHQGLMTNSIVAITVNNSSLWVATQRGLFRSTDGGRSWVRANQGIPVSAFAYALTFYGGRVFAALGSNGTVTQGASPRGVFAFDEKSGIWQAVNDGLGTANVVAFFNHNGELYAGADLGLFRFETAKATWIPLNNGLRGNVAALTARGSNLFAASGGDIFISSNRGESWTALNATFAFVQFATGFATNNAGTYVSTPSGIYFRANDSPSSQWKHANQGLSQAYVVDIVTQGQNLWAASQQGQVYFSNNGNSWTSMSNGLNGQTLTSIAANTTSVYVATEKAGVFGLAINGNQRDTWVATNQGLNGAQANDLLTVGENAFVATDQGIFRSPSFGAAWTKAGSQSAEVEKFYAPSSLSSDGTTIYAVYALRGQGSNSSIELKYYDNPNPVFRSSDNGAKWEQIGLRTGVQANFRQVLPTTQGILALGPGGTVVTNDYSKINYASVWFSSDKGQSWKAATDGLPPLYLLTESVQSNLANARLGATATRAYFAGGGGIGIFERDLVSLPCTFEVIAKEGILPATANAFMVKVNATNSTCAWNFDSRNDWISISGGQSRSGSGEVHLNIAPNPTNALRYGSVSIAGQTVNLTQYGCAVRVAPTDFRVEAAGGLSTLNISGASTCGWEIKNNASWISTPVSFGVGERSLNITVAANLDNQARQAVFFINGNQITVTQAAAQGSCSTKQLSPGQWVTGTISQNDCVSSNELKARNIYTNYYSFSSQLFQPWTLTVFDPSAHFPFPAINVPELVVMSQDGSIIPTAPVNVELSQQFSASKQVRFLAPAPGNYSVLVQSAPGPYLLRLAAAEDCAITMSRTSQTVPASGLSANVAIQTGSSCAWQAVSTAPWVRLQGAQTGKGDNALAFTVEPNLGAERTGHILVNNRIFALVQNANVDAARSLTGLAPSYVEAGSTGILLTLTGNNFTNASKVMWGSKALATTFVSTTQLRAALPATELTNPREILVRVETPTPTVWNSTALSFVVRPAPQFWTAVNGPAGGEISTLHQKGTRLYAGTMNGRVYSSNDGGKSWQLLTNLQDSSILSIGTTDRFIFAVTTQGVFVSELKSASSTWTLLNTLSDGNAVTGIATFATSLVTKGERVFAVINSLVTRLSSQGSWEQLKTFGNNPGNQSFLKLATSGDRASDSLYALQNSIDPTTNLPAYKLWVSNDDGQVWRGILLGFAAGVFLNDIFVLNKQVYFATSHGVFRLNEREQVSIVGNAPTNTANTAPVNVKTLALANGTLYASTVNSNQPNFDEIPIRRHLFRLESNETWASADEGLELLTIFTMVNTANGLLAGTNNGLWLSADQGKTWRENNQGLSAQSVFHLTAIGNTLFAGGENGIHRSSNYGTNWTKADEGLPLQQIPGRFALDQTTGNLRYTTSYFFSAFPSKIAANNDRLYAAFPQGIYRSTNQGESWQNTGLTGYFVNAFGFAGNQVFTGALKSNVSPWTTFQPAGITNLAALSPYDLVDLGAYRSANGAGNWTTNNNSLFGDLPTAFVSLGTKTFASTTREGIRVSDDGGQSWRMSNNGLNTGNVTTLAAINNTLLAGTDQGVFRSNDQGQNWRLTGAPNTPASALVTLNNSAFLLSNNLVYRTNDFGETWTQLPGANDFLLTSLQAIGDRLFAGTIGDGVIVANLAPGVATAVNAASYAGGEIAPNSMATLFGTNLSTATMLATSADLPEELAGTRVIVRSTTGSELAAKLFFVSPGQINFLLPQMDTNAVPSQIFVITPNGTQAVADIRLSATALGLFTANGNGQGAPAAVALRVKNGAATYEPVTRFDSTQNRFVPLPLDVNPANGTLYLVLYGTGIDGRAILANVTATAGDQALSVVYAGPQGNFVGLDQLNLGLPASLAGRGELDLKVTVNGKAANTLRVAFK